ARGATARAAIRQRIDRIGQAEFDEIRSILRQDDRLLPPADDRETFAELAALYLELRHFAPGLLRTTFPGLVENGRVDEVLAAEVDARALLDRSCRAGADKSKAARAPAPATAPSATGSGATAFLFSDLFTRRAPTPLDAGRLGDSADAAARRGNLVRAALLRAIAATGD